MGAKLGTSVSGTALIGAHAIALSLDLVAPFLDSFRILMNQNLGIGERLLHAVHDLIRNFMGRHKGQIAVHFDVQLNEPTFPR